MFSIAICHHTGDKWQSKTLFISIFDLRSSIVDDVFDCLLPGVRQCICFIYVSGQEEGGGAIRIPEEETVNQGDTEKPAYLSIQEESFGSRGTVSNIDYRGRNWLWQDHSDTTIPTSGCKYLTHTQCESPRFLLEAVEQFQILIIEGETGSGKTTQILQYLFQAVSI